MSELLEQIKAVAQARKIKEGATKAKVETFVRWEEEHKDVIEAAEEAEETVKEAEALLRELTLQAYAETGDKAPAEGVGIRERTVLTYDGKVAFDWAKSHKMALQLDKKAFEKIAKADTPDFVKVSTEAIATIATELKVE